MDIVNMVAAAGQTEGNLAHKLRILKTHQLDIVVHESRLQKVRLLIAGKAQVLHVASW